MSTRQDASAAAPSRAQAGTGARSEATSRLSGDGRADGGGSAPRADVVVDDVRLAFGDKAVFDALSCRFPHDRISVILGASGCGKSTLLRCLALLATPDFGSIRFGEQALVGLGPRDARRFRHRVGMLFQHGALLDSMTVFENVALPLREHTHMTSRQIADAVHAQLAAVGLQKVDDLLPGELSGGMQKRVGLARAMVRQPEILLCDEPLSGLDPVAVRMIESLLRDVSLRARVTMIITSHHIASTLRMADHVVFLIGGRAISGTTGEIQRHPDPRLRAFLEASRRDPSRDAGGPPGGGVEA